MFISPLLRILLRNTSQQSTDTETRTVVTIEIIWKYLGESRFRRLTWQDRTSRDSTITVHGLWLEKNLNASSTSYQLLGWRFPALSSGDPKELFTLKTVLVTDVQTGVRLFYECRETPHEYLGDDNSRVLLVRRALLYNITVLHTVCVSYHCWGPVFLKCNVM